MLPGDAFSSGIRSIFLRPFPRENRVDRTPRIIGSANTEPILISTNRPKSVFELLHDLSATLEETETTDRRI